MYPPPGVFRDPVRHYERNGRFSYVPVPGFRLDGHEKLPWKMMVGPEVAGVSTTVAVSKSVNARRDAQFLNYFRQQVLRSKVKYKPVGKLEQFETEQGDLVLGFAVRYDLEDVAYRRVFFIVQSGHTTMKVVFALTAAEQAGDVFDEPVKACVQSIHLKR